MSLIELKNVSKSFGEHMVLSDINLSIEAGDVYGVLGLSGAGKSTLVRCINGLEKFDSGELLYNGEPASFDRGYRRKVAMIFQSFNLLQQRTVLKNVELAGELIKSKSKICGELTGDLDKENLYVELVGTLVQNDFEFDVRLAGEIIQEKNRIKMELVGESTKEKSSIVVSLIGKDKKSKTSFKLNGKLIKDGSKSNIRLTGKLINNKSKITVRFTGRSLQRSSKKEEAIRLLNLVGLGDKLNAYPSTLSGGQQQRVAIARALMTKPEVLLCDEATSALDPDTTKSILNLLKELNKKLGLTIIIISHQMSVIEAICNKVAIIDNSKIVENGLMYDVFLSPQNEIAKKLIYSGHLNTKLNDNKLIKLIFNGEVDSPIICNIIQDCNILVSIVYADSKTVNEKVYGQMIFKLPYYQEDIEKLKKYLELKGIKYEEVDPNGLE